MEYLQKYIDLNKEILQLKDQLEEEGITVTGVPYYNVLPNGNIVAGKFWSSPDKQGVYFTAQPPIKPTGIVNRAIKLTNYTFITDGIEKLPDDDEKFSDDYMIQFQVLDNVTGEFFKG